MKDIPPFRGLVTENFLNFAGEIATGLSAGEGESTGGCTPIRRRVHLRIKLP